MSSLTSHREVPGDSPACYVGDPSNNILSIEALDLVPNPPVEYISNPQLLCLPFLEACTHEP